MNKNSDQFTALSGRGAFTLNVLRKINFDPNISQRKLANELNMSLGKINYCLKKLKNKGLIKMRRFKKKNKFNYTYILTSSGVTFKEKNTIVFLKRKTAEYQELKNEINK